MLKKWQNLPLPPRTLSGACQLSAWWNPRKHPTEDLNFGILNRSCVSKVFNINQFMSNLTDLWLVVAAQTFNSYADAKGIGSIYGKPKRNVTFWFHNNQIINLILEILGVLRNDILQICSQDQGQDFTVRLTKTWNPHAHAHIPLLATIGPSKWGFESYLKG